MTPTLELLRKMSNELEEEQERIGLCKRLMICPECGAKIISKREEALNTPKKYLFGLFTQKYILWDRRLICSVDVKHFEEKVNYLDDVY